MGPIMTSFIVGLIIPSAALVVILFIIWFIVKGSPWSLAMARLRKKPIQLIFGEDSFAEMKSMEKIADGVFKEEEKAYDTDGEDKYMLDGKMPLFPIVEGVGKNVKIPAAYYADCVINDAGAGDLESAIQKEYQELLNNEKFAKRVEQLKNRGEADNVQQAVEIAYREHEGKGLPSIKFNGESFNMHRFKNYMTNSFSPHAMYKMAQQMKAAYEEKLSQGMLSSKGSKIAVVIIIIIIVLVMLGLVAASGGGGGGGGLFPSAPQGVGMILPF
jgi:hypothetical protein